jgi:hypothetical protein
MKISELRDWATVTYGAHSHKEGQIHAALGPLEEWLGHLARHGVSFELVTSEDAAKLPSSLKPLHAVDEPPAYMNSGATSVVTEVPLGDGLSPPQPDPATFVVPSAPSKEPTP